MKPNYSFEKRQRELARKRKKEEKLKEKQARRAVDTPAQPPPSEGAPPELKGS